MEILNLLTSNNVVVMDGSREYVTEYVTSAIENGASENYKVIGFLVIIGLLIVILAFCAKELKSLLKFIGYAYIIISTIGAFALMDTDKGFVVGFTIFMQGTLLGSIAIGISKLLGNTKNERLEYIEELVIYTKNQVKEISAKVDKISSKGKHSYKE